MKDKWIETLAAFQDDNMVIQKDEWSEFCFKLSEVRAFNKTEQGLTTVTLNLLRQTIAIKYDVFKELMQEFIVINEVMDSQTKFEFLDK